MPLVQHRQHVVSALLDHFLPILEQLVVILVMQDIILMLEKSHCTVCPQGHYSSSSGSASCAPCAAGYYTSSTGSTQCQICPSGSYASAGSSSCTQCTAGTYAEETGSAECIDCPAGTHSSGTGSTSCQTCTAGTYAASGSAECSPCAVQEVLPVRKVVVSVSLALLELILWVLQLVRPAVRECILSHLDLLVAHPAPPEVSTSIVQQPAAHVQQERINPIPDRRHASPVKILRIEHPLGMQQCVTCLVWVCICLLFWHQFREYFSWAFMIFPICIEFVKQDEFNQNQ